MKSTLKAILVDFLRILLIFYSVVYFLLALASYFENYLSIRIFYQPLLEKIILKLDILNLFVKDSKASEIINYFIIGLILLIINFLLDSLQENLNVIKKTD